MRRKGTGYPMTEQERFEAKECYLRCRKVAKQKKVLLRNLYRAVGIEPTNVFKIQQGKARVYENWQDILNYIEETTPDKEYKTKKKELNVVLSGLINGKEIYYASQGSGKPLIQIDEKHPLFGACKEDQLKIKGSVECEELNRALDQQPHEHWGKHV